MSKPIIAAKTRAIINPVLKASSISPHPDNEIATKRQMDGSDIFFMGI